MRMAKLRDIAERFGMGLIGGGVTIDGLGLCNRKSVYKSMLSYATDERFLNNAAENESVSAVVLDGPLSEYASKNFGGRLTVLVSDKPENDFYRIHEYLYEHTDFYDHFDFPASYGKCSVIHPSAVIEDGVVIGNDVTVGANSRVARGSVIGNGVSIGCNTAVGSEGFQIIYAGNIPARVIHAGGCRISNGASVANNTVISKSLFEGETFVGENAAIDSLVSIAHNCVVERNAVITAGVKLCGSVTIRQGAWIGSGSVVLNRVTIGEGATLGIGCIAIRDIPDGAVAVGNPARIIKFKHPSDQNPF